MTKTELIAQVASRNDMHTPAERFKVKCIVGDVLDVIAQTVAAGDKVVLPGFGTFELKTRAARKGINPRTGEEIQLPSSKRMTFKQGKAIKEALSSDGRRIKQRAQPRNSNPYVRKDAPWTEDVGY